VYLVCVAGVVSGSSLMGHRGTMGERMDDDDDDEGHYDSMFF